MAYTPVPSVAAGDWIDEIFINTYWRDNMAASVPDVFSAKGQMAVGSGVDTMGVLNVGANGTIIVADSVQSLGVKWDYLLNQIYAQEGAGLNYQILRSVVTNDLTVAIKDKNGNDASSTNPISFRIGTSSRNLTAALSITALDGSNYCLLGSAELAAKDTDVFVYVGWRASDASIFLAVSRIPWAITYADFSATLANAKYAIYSGAAPAGTDEVICIGRVNVQLSAAASYQWSVPATSIIVSKPIFETRLLTWAPTISGYSANPSSAQYQYQIVGEGGSGKILIFIYEPVDGTSNNALHSYTLPFPSALNSTWALPIPKDNGAVVAAGIASVSSTNLVVTRSTDVAWTASGASRIGNNHGWYKG